MGHAWRRTATAAVLGLVSGYAAAHVVRRTGRVASVIALGEDPNATSRRPQPAGAWPDELHAVRLVLPDEFDLARRILLDSDGDGDTAD
ncbi:hypothetical protein [Streptomyces sp. NPDC049881]|uniref:hypothetical protein n=1 Tax=Streptomyces sp. NPDC049881 TaxID=3155778 RepID=UPI00341AFB7E